MPMKGREIISLKSKRPAENYFRRSSAIRILRINLLISGA
jgi:hypothetical protein